MKDQVLNITTVGYHNPKKFKLNYLTISMDNTKNTSTCVLTDSAGIPFFDIASIKENESFKSVYLRGQEVTGVKSATFDSGVKRVILGVTPVDE